MIFSARLASRVLFPSSLPRSTGLRSTLRRAIRAGARDRRATGTAVEVTAAHAGWKYIRFAVRHVGAGGAWVAETDADECCMVLLRGTCEVEYTVSRKTQVATLGPRRDVFLDYPHAVYLPPRTHFRIRTAEG